MPEVRSKLMKQHNIHSVGGLDIFTYISKKVNNLPKTKSEFLPTVKTMQYCG